MSAAFQSRRSALGSRTGEFKGSFSSDQVCWASNAACLISCITIFQLELVKIIGTSFMSKKFQCQGFFYTAEPESQCNKSCV